MGAVGKTGTTPCRSKSRSGFSHGLNLSYNFTWSKSLDNGIETVENDVFNRAQNKYLSVSDRPLVSNININYIVPVPEFTGNKILKFAF